MQLLPKVFRTEGDWADFDPSKIFDSIIKETGMNEQDARHVTELVVRRIISSGIRFLSGPHIREIVCSILSEQHFEDERKRYTRIGMAIGDYEEILEKGPKVKSGEVINPEIIHHYAANQLAEEYTLLRILNDEESKAHLYGDIYIHKLKYFDLRPLSQTWDPRMILENGLPPIINSSICCKSGPAEDLTCATHHLAEWLGMTQGEFCGAQGLEFITIFLAPYIKNLSDTEIKHRIQNFIYEINQLSAILSRDTPRTSIFCCPDILEPFSKKPAIGPKGKISGVYEDYKNESLKLFNGITEVFLKGDYHGNSFVFPKHIIYMNRDWLERHEDSYSNVWQEAISRDSPYLINLCSDWQKKEIDVQYSNNTYYNFGTLQNISLNLPRYAYISKNEKNFIAIVRDMMNLCSRIFVKKYTIIEKRLNSKHLPLCSSYIKNGEQLFKLENQNFAFNFVGLNEAVKYLTNQELHENIDAFNFGKNIIKEMKKICEELTRKTGKKHIIQENVSNSAAYRFAKLDLKHFAKIAIPQTFNGIRCYTNSIQFKENLVMNIDEKINKQSVFHDIIQNGHNFYNLSLKDVHNNAQNLHKLILDICTTSHLACIKFSQ